MLSESSNKIEDELVHKMKLILEYIIECNLPACTRHLWTSIPCDYFSSPHQHSRVLTFHFQVFNEKQSQVTCKTAQAHKLGVNC